MTNDDEYTPDFEGWVDREEDICIKCERPFEMPKKDGPYEYYEDENGLHGLYCRRCERKLCDECTDWKTNEEGLTVCFECFDKERHSRIDLAIHNAIIFACRKHDKHYRKSTDIPYVSHLMEVMQILIENNCSDEVIIAGILHDVLEDTETKPDEILTLFGSKVLSIVNSETEDKKLSWMDRKLNTIKHLHTATTEVQLVCCADKLSNMRCIYSDLKTIGEKVWERFNAEKEQIKMYYEGVLSAISDISESDMYYELSDLIEDVFYLDWSSYGKED